MAANTTDITAILLQNIDQEITIINEENKDKAWGKCLKDMPILTIKEKSNTVKIVANLFL